MPTRNQQLATIAYDQVIHFRNINTLKDDDGKPSYGEMDCRENEHPDKCRKQGKTNQKKYGTMAHKLPVLVRTAGLAQ